MAHTGYKKRIQNLMNWLNTNAVGSRPTDVDDLVTKLWFFQQGMAIGLLHPEYANAWLDGEPEEATMNWNFRKASHDLVRDVDLETG